jgi:hypothetical protein
MTSEQYLHREIQKIKERNKRVEADKAWETSKTRSVFIATASFIVIYVFMLLVNAGQPFFNALISALTYLLSTFSYDLLKKWWLHKQQKST